MADIKIEKGTPIFRPGLSEEEKAAAAQALEEYFVGAEQKMIGEGREEAVRKFVELLDSQNPERLKKLEEQIKSLHGMEKFQRFRVQVFLILLDTFQGGMHFALDKKAIDNQWDLVKVLDLTPPKADKK